MNYEEMKSQSKIRKEFELIDHTIEGLEKSAQVYCKLIESDKDVEYISGVLGSMTESQFNSVMAYCIDMLRQGLIMAKKARMESN